MLFLLLFNVLSSLTLNQALYLWKILILNAPLFYCFRPDCLVGLSFTRALMTCYFLTRIRLLFIFVPLISTIATYSILFIHCYTLFFVSQYLVQGLNRTRQHILPLSAVSNQAFLLYHFTDIGFFENAQSNIVVLFKDLIGQLVVNVNLIFLIGNMQVVAVGHIFTLHFLQKIFAVLYRPIYRRQLMIPVEVKIVSRLCYKKGTIIANEAS
jgi:hypothetical protein